MPLWINIAAQIIGVAIAIFAVPELVPHPLVLRWMLAFGAFTQAAVAVVSHFYNTDGTRQQVAFDPTKKP